MSIYIISMLLCWMFEVYAMTISKSNLLLTLSSKWVLTLSFIPVINTIVALVAFVVMIYDISSS